MSRGDGMGDGTPLGPGDVRGSGGSPSRSGGQVVGRLKEGAELWALWAPELVLRLVPEGRGLELPPRLEQPRPGISLSCWKGPGSGTGQGGGELVWLPLRGRE